MKVLASIQRVTRDEWGWAHGFGWALSLKFEPRDLWIGVYWTRSSTSMLDIYLCVLPCLPINLTLWGLS